MRKQKWASAALAVTILFGGVPVAVQAESTVAQGTLLSQQQAVEIAKKFFAIGADFKLESASQNARYRRENDSVWMLSWREETFAERNSISVVIDAQTGEPLEFSVYDRGPQPAAKPITVEQARQKALDLLAKIAPEKAKSVKEVVLSEEVKTVNGDKTSNIYGFRFTREVNGVKVNTDGFDVVFDRSGNLRTYHLDWAQEDSQFPKTDGVLSAEQATAKYKAALPLRLEYAPRYLPGVRVPTMALIYSAESKNIDLNVSDIPVMDATSGELIAINGTPLPKQGPLAPLTEKPSAALTDSPLDKDGAVALVKRYYPQLDAAYELTSSEYVTGDTMGSAWRFRYEYKGTGESKGGNDVLLTIDAATGELRDLINWQHSEPNQTAAVSWEQAKNAAVEYLKLAVPTKTHRYVLTTLQSDMDVDTMKVMGDYTYRYEFSYLVNGLPSAEQSISIGVSSLTGKVEQFGVRNGSSIAESKFPDPKQAISEEKARELYSQKFPLELQYVRLTGSKAADGKLTPPRYVLAYVPQHTGIRLDAVTGQWFNQNGSAADRTKIEDIKGHWAEEYLQRLVDLNIFALDEKGNVRPEEAVSRGDAMRILVMFLASSRMGAEKSASSYDDVSPTDPNYEFIETAVMLGWLPRDLKEFHPNAPMQRGELAKLMVSVLGYGELAQKTNVFLKPFDDISAKDANYGSIAVAKALGLMSGSGSKFLPQSAVSRAEMSVVVTHLLSYTENHRPIF